MSKFKQLAVMAAGAMALATMFETSAFADSRPRGETWRGARQQQRGNVTMEGRIRAMNYDRDGYRIELDRGGYSFFVPRDRARGLDLRIGINVRFGGYYDSRGYVYVDDARCLDRYDDRYADRGRYDSRTLRGVVDDVDYRSGIVVLRDDYSGRYVRVAMARRSRGVDLDDLRRGDYVTVEGDWLRENIFEASRIDSVKSRRW